MIDEYTIGPLLPQTDGYYWSYYYDPYPIRIWIRVGEPVTRMSKVPAFRRHRYNTSQRRRKPVGIESLKEMTNYQSSTITETAGFIIRNVGNVRPLISAGVVTDLDSMEQARRASVQRTLSSLKNTTWNLSTFIGELPETASFIVSVARGLVSSVLAVKRGDMRTLQRTIFPRKGKGESYYGGRMMSKTASDKWLQWRYAVQPMMYDADDMLKALYETRTRPLISHVKRGANESYHNVRISSDEMIYTDSQQTRVTTGVYYKVNPTVDGFKRLGLLNPLETLWELTPLSFVFDWFLPIGDYVANLDAMAGVEIYSSYQSTRVTSTQEVNVHSTGEWPDSGTPSLCTKNEYTRMINPNLSVPLPQFSVGLNMHRVIDAVSLLRNFAK